MVPRRATATLFAGLAAANVAAWLWAWSAFADRPALLGTALLAWVFGLRHALDPDHIAAIDNVVRKLMQTGRRPISVGLFFSLGHSTVVMLACAALAGLAATGMLGGAPGQDGGGRLAAWQAVGGGIGTAVSAAFLLVIAMINVAILRDVWRLFRRARRGFAVPEVETLQGGGLLARLFRPVMAMVTRSGHMYPVGFLFGLGFDTATEVGLLGIAATQAASGLSPWSILVFPALFTAGMSLVDTADSVMMVGAYGWAFVHPLRKLWYNLTLTAASVFVAVFIGGLEALGLIADKFGLEDGVWAVVAHLNDNLTNLGFVVVGLFALSWAVSAAIYRLKGFDRLEQRRR